MPFNTKTIVPVILGLIIAITGVQALMRPAIKPSHPPVQSAPCEGTAIEVDYPYGGGLMGPHECIVQCDLNKPHYILYADGTGAQCERLPGCSDWGEDNGVTCKPST